MTNVTFGIEILILVSIWKWSLEGDRFASMIPSLKGAHALLTNMSSFFRFLILVLALSGVAFSQSYDGGFYRLTTSWLGDEKSLDVINDGTNNQLWMTHTADQTGQFWKLTPLGNGYFRLTTSWRGDGWSLDVVNDGINDKVQLAKTDNVTGQYWKITPVSEGYYRLTTKWLGEGKSLDIVNDASKNKLRLAASGDYSGQLWKITGIRAAPAAPDKRKFAEVTRSGFKIFYDSAKSEDADTKTTIDILSRKLAEIEKIVKPKHLERLKNVPVWIEYIKKTDGAMWYHPSKDWLLSNGYPETMAKSVEVKHTRNFIDWQGDQPYMVLHEFAHAHQDQFNPDLQEKLDRAYRNALASGKYDSVAYVRGGFQKAYAMKNKVEYFAELTEAYFGKNDYYPFTNADLKEFDPLGYELTRAAWE